MNPFTDKTIRELTSIWLQIIREKHQGDRPFSLTLEILDMFMSELTRYQRIANRNARRYFSLEMFACHVLVVAVGELLHIVDGYRENGVQLFPADWYADIPDPEFIVQSQLMQIANHGLAALRLIEDGLDTPARVVVRTLIELSLHLIIFSGDKKSFTQYVVAKTPDDLTKLWHNTLKSKVLLKRIEAVTRDLIERNREMGIDLELPSWVGDYWKNLYSRYSEAVHPSVLMLAAGSFGPSWGKNDVRKPVLFGSVTPLSKETVSSVLEMLAMVVMHYPQMLVTLYGFSISEANMDYRLYCGLRELGLSLWWLLIERENPTIIDSLRPLQRA